MGHRPFVGAGQSCGGHELPGEGFQLTDLTPTPAVTARAAGRREGDRSPRVGRPVSPSVVMPVLVTKLVHTAATSTPVSAAWPVASCAMIRVPVDTLLRFTVLGGTVMARPPPSTERAAAVSPVIEAQAGPAVAKSAAFWAVKAHRARMFALPWNIADGNGQNDSGSDRLVRRVVGPFALRQCFFFVSVDSVMKFLT
jgi:hypothetical protein